MLKVEREEREESRGTYVSLSVVRRTNVTYRRLDSNKLLYILFERYISHRSIIAQICLEYSRLNLL